MPFSRYAPCNYRTMLKILWLSICPLVDTFASWLRFLIPCHLEERIDRISPAVSGSQTSFIVCVTRQTLLLTCSNMVSGLGAKRLSV